LFPALSQAIDRAVMEAADNDLICITGSLFVVGEARAYLEKSLRIPKAPTPTGLDPSVLTKS
jgi:folylpolyglutamate synthase/dihydropteroate synthase